MELTIELKNYLDGFIPINLDEIDLTSACPILDIKLVDPLSIDDAISKRSYEQEADIPHLNRIKISGGKAEIRKMTGPVHFERDNQADWTIEEADLTKPQDVIHEQGKSSNLNLGDPRAGLIVPSAFTEKYKRESVITQKRRGFYTTDGPAIPGPVKLENLRIREGGIGAQILEQDQLEDRITGQTRGGGFDGGIGPFGSGVQIKFGKIDLHRDSPVIGERDERISDKGARDTATSGLVDTVEPAGGKER